MMAGLPGLRYNFSRTDINNESSSSPLFERQMNNDEYTEYQQLRGIIDGLHQRIAKLEKINTDLENRLEEQAKESLQVETDYINLDRAWKEKSEILSQEILKWKMEYEAEKIKNNRLRDHLSNTEKELYTILQRKHELMRGPASMKGPHPGKLSASESGLLNKRDHEPSDIDMYQNTSEKVKNLLLDHMFE